MNKPIKQIAIVIPYRFEQETFWAWTQKRKSNDELNGLLEFPGGKVEQRESLKEAACREIEEEVGVIIQQKSLQFYQTYNNELDTKIISLNIFFYLDNKGLFPLEGWGPLSTMGELEKLAPSIPPANYIFLSHFIKSNDFNRLDRN